MKKLFVTLAIIIIATMTAGATTLEQVFDQFTKNPRAVVTEVDANEARAYNMDRSTVCIITDANEMDTNMANDIINGIPAEMQRTKVHSGNADVAIYVEPLNELKSQMIIFVSADSQLVVVFGEGDPEAINNYHI